MASPRPVQHTPVASALSQLLARAAGSRTGDLQYAGDITPEDAYSFIQSNPALLIDVRTVPEWQFTGVPDLSNTQGQLVTLCWKFYPDFSQNTKFAEQLSTVPAINEDTPLLFICRSGGRSLDAAVAMTGAGYRHCFNIEGGFEGDADINGHRGTREGWKAKHLPWKQG